MKVGIITYDLSIMRGGTRLAIMLGQELQREGFEVAFSAVYEDLKSLENKFGETYNFKVFKPKRPFLAKKLANISSYWNLNPSVKKMCLEFKPDIVIEIGGVIAPLKVPIKLKIPTIHYVLFPASCYSTINIYKVGLLNKLYSGLCRHIELSIIHKVNKIISMCSFTKRLVKDVWKVDTESISPPVNTDLIVPLKKRNLILSVLVFNEIHRIEEMIDNFISLNKPNYELVITGQKDNEEYYNKLVNKYKNNSNIKILSEIPFDELKKFYGESKIFWYPVWTHYGFIMAEAQSAGCIVIAPGGDRGAGDIIINNESGFIVEKFEEIFDKTKDIIDNDKLMNKMSKKARENAIERLGIYTFREKFVKAIKETIKN